MELHPQLTSTRRRRTGLIVNMHMTHQQIGATQTAATKLVAQSSTSNKCQQQQQKPNKQPVAFCFHAPKWATFSSLLQLTASILLLLIVQPAHGQAATSQQANNNNQQQHILTGHLHDHHLQQQQTAAAAAAAQQFEQQLMAQLGTSSQGHQQQQTQISHQISAPSTTTSSSPSISSSSSSASLQLEARSRSPRSIGDMFKKLFNGNKRSKQSQSNREWEQQQQLQQLQQQQQQQQLQQQQSQAMAATLAAAAANQHAVYASPFAAYASPAHQTASASALYSQFAPYSSAGLVAWPTTANLAQALRAAPTLIGPPSPAGAVTLAGSGPLYAAASQSYNSYAAPPPQVALPSPHQSGSQVGNPTAAASHTHASAVPPPPGMSPHPSNSALDFHQVLDALVRTSGFAPAGDQEAAAGSGYGAKSDGTPVFSFKKLVSLPFYLSTEEKDLGGLANAVGPGTSGGYSLHSMPIMRRHVRRMSTPASQQQQQHQQQNQQQHYNNLASAMQQVADSSQQRSERAQQHHYNSYINSINNQLAAMTANNQIMQYLSQQQSQPTLASPLDAYSAEAALANYQALAVLGAQQSPSPYKSSGIGNRNGGGGGGSSQNNNANLAMAASVITPTAVQPPQGLIQQQTINQKQQQQQQQQYEQQQQQQEIQSILSSMQQQLSANQGNDPYFSSTFATSPFANQIQIQQQQHQSPSQISTLTDGHRFGAQQQPQQQLYWASNGSNQFSDGSSLLTINSNGNSNNNGQDYTSGQLAASSPQLSIHSLSGSPQSQQQIGAANGNANSMMGVQNNAMEHQQLNHLAQQQQSGISQSQSASSSNSGGSQSSSQLADSVGSISPVGQMSVQQQQQQSALNTQQSQQQQQSSLVSSQQHNSNSNNNNNFGPASRQIEGQQK